LAEATTLGKRVKSNQGEKRGSCSPYPVPEAVLLQEFLGKVFEITLGERDI